MTSANTAMEIQNNSHQRPLTRAAPVPAGFRADGAPPEQPASSSGPYSSGSTDRGRRGRRAGREMVCAVVFTGKDLSAG
ncbi:hypothetical protein Nm8I071_33340 [Nonomuraea sp. TT08I-71]|nr:hypothetical protein Nm8I071_33340 [Nonomuraea sp. TT08I-71]